MLLLVLVRLKLMLRVVLDVAAVDPPAAATAVQVLVAAPLLLLVLLLLLLICPNLLGTTAHCYPLLTPNSIAHPASASFPCLHHGAQIQRTILARCVRPRGPPQPE